MKKVTAVVDLHGFRRNWEGEASELGPLLVLPPIIRLSSVGVAGDAPLAGNEEPMLLNSRRFRRQGNVQVYVESLPLYVCAGCSLCEPDMERRVIAMIATRAATEAVAGVVRLLVDRLQLRGAARRALMVGLTPRRRATR